MIKNSSNFVAYSKAAKMYLRSAGKRELKAAICPIIFMIHTGQFFCEGTYLHNATYLFLAYPFPFQGKLIQYIGRVQRSELSPIIYDYRDSKIDYLNKMFLKRNCYYRKLERQVSLFADPIEEEIVSVEKVAILTIDKEINVAIELLEFRYGSIAFTYASSELNMKIEFEVQHDDIHPEF